MTLVPTDESKYILEKQEELWNKIKDLIRSKTNNSNDYNEKYATNKYNSDDDIILVVVRSALKTTITVRKFFYMNVSSVINATF